MKISFSSSPTVASRHLKLKTLEIFYENVKRGIYGGFLFLTFATTTRRRHEELCSIRVLPLSMIYNRITFNLADLSQLLCTFFQHVASRLTPHFVQLVCVTAPNELFDYFIRIFSFTWHTKFFSLFCPTALCRNWIFFSYYTWKFITVFAGARDMTGKFPSFVRASPIYTLRKLITLSPHHSTDNDDVELGRVEIFHPCRKKSGNLRWWS